VTTRRASVSKRVAAAAVAVVLVLFVFVPLLRELVDVFGADEDSIDSVVRTIVLWVLASLLVAAIYACLVEGLRALARLGKRRKGVTRR
jgi:hypothetical protein